MYTTVDDVFSVWQQYVVGEIELPESAVSKHATDKPDFRTTALVIAIKRVADATLLRGIWP